MMGTAGPGVIVQGYLIEIEQIFTWPKWPLSTSTVIWLCDIHFKKNNLRLLLKNSLSSIMCKFLGVCMTALIQSERAGWCRPQHAGKFCNAASSDRRLLFVDENPRNAKKTEKQKIDKIRNRKAHKRCLAVFSIGKYGECFQAKGLNRLSEQVWTMCCLPHQRN